MQKQRRRRRRSLLHLFMFSAPHVRNNSNNVDATLLPYPCLFILSDLGDPNHNHLTGFPTLTSQRSGDTWTAFSSGPRHGARAWKGRLHMNQMNRTLRSSVLRFTPGRLVWKCPSGLLYSHEETCCGSDRTAARAASTLISLPPLFTTRSSFSLN